jgi:hypothetical protein
MCWASARVLLTSLGITPRAFDQLVSDITIVDSFMFGEGNSRDHREKQAT